MKTVSFATIASLCLFGAIALAQPPAPGGGAPGPGGGAPAPGGGTPSPGGGAPAPGGAPAAANPLFQHTVCNKSNYNAWVAISNRVKPGGNVWRNHGWYAVPRGACQYMGTFPKGTYYWYAIDDQNGHWGGDGKDPDELTCVNLRAAFDFSYSDTAGACPAGMQSARFIKLQNVTTDTVTSTLNN
jgi:uncharacterized membrane protein